jgi:hypothetical protein
MEKVSYRWHLKRAKGEPSCPEAEAVPQDLA